MTDKAMDNAFDAKIALEVLDGYVEKTENVDGKFAIKFTHKDLAGLVSLLKDAIETEDLFDRMWDADMRGIKLWQAETGEELTWPDRANHMEWMLKRNDLIKAAKQESPWVPIDDPIVETWKDGRPLLFRYWHDVEVSNFEAQISSGNYSELRINKTDPAIVDYFHVAKGKEVLFAMLSPIPPKEQ